MPVRELKFYETDSGRCHVVDFVESIRSHVERAKITSLMEVLARTPVLPVHYFKKLRGHDLWELRVLQYRFLGFYDPAAQAGQQVFVFVHAFSKQSQKTPQPEISVASKRQQAYLSRQRELFAE